MVASTIPQVSISQKREELIFLLDWAAELEHSLACTYLYASASLKVSPNEGGITADQALRVQEWKRRIQGVAIDEMDHLAQVTNLLTAIGGAPHFTHSHFPQPAATYPLGLTLALEPFGAALSERFVCYETPEAGILSTEEDTYYADLNRKVRQGDPYPEEMFTSPKLVAQTHKIHGLEPYMLDFGTVGEFYRRIQERIADCSETDLFIGNPDNQANPSYLELRGDLMVVRDANTANSAINRIVEQGEAPPKVHPNAHFWVFDAIRKEYDQIRAGDPGFAPFRQVAANPATARQPVTRGQATISDPTAHDVAELFNVTYDTLLLMLNRLFYHTDETHIELKSLATSAIGLMRAGIAPLGEALTKLPLGPQDAPTRAGPPFAFYNVEFLPHKHAAWHIIGERLGDIALQAEKLVTTGSPPELAVAATGLRQVAASWS